MPTAGRSAGTSLVRLVVALSGVRIASSVGSGCRIYSGTSMAVPLVAGVAALVKQAPPSIGPTEIADMLRRTAVDLGPTGPDPSYGAGLVDALAAVSAVSATPPAAPAPTPVPVPAPAGEPTPTTPVPPRPAAPEP